MSVNQNFPEVSPSLLLDFANSRTLDPRITFTRSSIGTYVASNGLIKTAAADEPRFDHDPETGESLGLLIEESRTNLLTYSEQFDQWTVGTNTTVTPNAVTAPDGTLTADRVFNPATGSTFIGNGTINVGTTYTVSVYAKAVTPGTNDKFTFNVGGTANNISSQFTATAEWQRFTFTTTPSIVSSQNNELFINNEGDGFASDIYVWGAQVEEGSFATSYIPTSGTSATRAVDQAYILGDNVPLGSGVDEYSFYVRGRLLDTANYNGISRGLVGMGSSTNERIRIPHNTSGAVEVYSGGTIQANLSIGDIGTVERQIAFAVKKDDFAVSVDGGTVVIDASGNIPTDITTIGLGQSTYDNPPVTYPSTCYIKEFRIYPKRLSNTQLQNLTK